MKQGSSRLAKWLVVIAYLAMVTVNALAQFLPINGVTTGEVSDAYPNLFSPAPITFGIWGLIYLLLLIFAVCQTGAFSGELAAAGRVRWLFVVSSLFNIGWVFCWHYYLIPLSLLCMLGLLVSLGAAYLRIRSEALSRRERFCVCLPFSVYFGWITIATIANVTTALVSVDWKGFGLPQTVWTVIALILGVIICLAVILEYRDPAYALTAVWAYAGILLRHLSPSGFDGEFPAVIWTAAISIAALLISAIWALRRRK